MIRRPLLPLALGLAAAATLAGCAMLSHPAPQTLAGVWTNSARTVWTLNADGTFEVDLDHNGKRDAWGKYSIAGETVTLTGTGGVMPRGCKGNGVYRFTRTGDQLHFTLVKDSCKLRVHNVLLAWHKK